MSVHHRSDFCANFTEGVGAVSGVSVTQPKLCPNATWNQDGITFANSSTIGRGPRSIFINANNTVYAVNHENGSIQIWLEGSPSPSKTLATNTSEENTIFVSAAGDLLISNWANNRVDVWRENATSYTSALTTGGQCFSLFIDANASLYCSLYINYKVIKRSLNGSENQLTTVAGTGCAGYQPYNLYEPSGICVASNFDLYVADAGNNRVQLFQPGQVNGTTVAGRDAAGTIQLNYPTAVMLDADGYLFIADFSNNRIVGSGPNGFRCVVGCTGEYGSALDELAHPSNIAFDSYGNVFVTDTDNDRVQKFVLSFNSCSKLSRG